MANDWSASEKKIARRVFDAALNRELAELMQTFKSMAANTTEPNDMWATEEFLSKRATLFRRQVVPLTPC